MILGCGRSFWHRHRPVSISSRLRILVSNSSCCSRLSTSGYRRSRPPSLHLYRQVRCYTPSCRVAHKIAMLRAMHFDEAYFGNLAAYVEVNEFEAVFHFILFENIESFEQFARVESEFADISSRVFPFSASRAGQFDTDSYVGADFQSFGNRCDEMQFV